MSITKCSVTTATMEKLCEEMAWVLSNSGYGIDEKDYGWAFDRAIFNLKIELDNWSEDNMTIFCDIWEHFKARGAK